MPEARMSHTPLLAPSEVGAPPRSSQSLKAVAGTLLLGVGVALLIGTLIDLGVLWLSQYEDSPQWEFSAIATTLDQYSLILVGLAGVASGLHLRGATGRFARGTVTFLCVLAMVAVIFLGLLLVTNFFAVRLTVEDDDRASLIAAAGKAGVIAAIDTLVLAAAAFRGLRQ